MILPLILRNCLGFFSNKLIGKKKKKKKFLAQTGPALAVWDHQTSCSLCVLMPALLQRYQFVVLLRNADKPHSLLSHKIKI